MNREEVIQGMRSCLISRKGMLSMRQLDSDFHTIMGTRIPFKQLGFPSLLAFLKSEPTLVVNDTGKEVFVDAKISEKSAHISDLVRKQKSAPAPKAKAYKRPVVSRPVRAVPPRLNSSFNQQYQPSARPKKVAHNQFVQQVSSKIVVPPHSTYAQNGTSTHHHNHKPASAAPQPTATRPRNNSAQAPPPAAQKQPAQKKPAQQLQRQTSARKRISDQMAGMQLETTDSGFSSPIAVEQFVPAPAVIRRVTSVEPTLTGNHILDLKKFAEYHTLGEVQVSFMLIKTKQNHMHSCKIKVGQQQYNSYPMEYKTESEAEAYCAKKALDDLVQTYGKRRSLLISSEMDILERIPSMLQKHSQAIWVWQLEKDYMDKYNEILPIDWLKAIDISPYIQWEKCQNNFIVRYCKPEDKGKILGTSFTLTDISVPSNTIKLIADEPMSGKITYVGAANEVWCRQFFTKESEEFEEMNGKMVQYYKEFGKGMLAKSVNVGGHYVTRYEDGWYRIKVVEKSVDSIVAFFIDYGHSEAVPNGNIYQLMREFATSQAQAFVCRLVDLEPLYNASESSECIQKLQGSHVIIEFVPEAADPQNEDVTLPVYMFHPDTGECLNDKWFAELAIESATPDLERNIQPEVYVSHIEPNGDIYVQVRSPGFFLLKSLLQELESVILTNPKTSLLRTVTKANTKNKIFFYYNQKDNHWHRIKFLDWSPDGRHAQIYFLDVGSTDVVRVADEVFYLIEDLNLVLRDIPPQAFRVKMALDDIPKNFVELASKQMPNDQPVLLKIIGHMGSIPVGEFFKNQDNGKFCIHKSLQLEAEISKVVPETKASGIRKISSVKNFPSGGRLKQPTIPEVEEFFQIHVPLAVNPYNFFVQPYESMGALKKMMENLQETYKDVQYSPLTIDDIIPGNIYVSKHDDGIWYRTSVIKVINPGCISVYYCDFGYYVSVTLQQLIPLGVEFMALPYQALKAKVANIKPKNSKWTMDDCDNFKRLVEKKNFYSIVMGVEKDEFYESDRILSLSLIDTSTADDVYVSKILIEEGIAVEAK